MRTHNGRAVALCLFALAVVVVLAGCASTSDGNETAGSDDPSDTPFASPSPTRAMVDFPTDAFADISEDPVSEEVAKEFQTALREMAGGGGMTATVMSPEGTWSGATGKANGVRNVGLEDQFPIGSVTKSVVAAQVMHMVEAGELDLEDPATDHLPPDLDFDTNGATIRHLLGMRSGIPDYWNEMKKILSTDRQRVWTTAELLDRVPDDRLNAGQHFGYSNTNYLLLELVIKQVSGRPVVDVLRDGVLDIEGIGRLIYQPDEKPTAPMAMPYGESTAALKRGGGYLPSIAAAASEPGGSMATDSRSLANWWRAFCSGEIVSPESLTEMATFKDGYGLGLFSLYGKVVGHPGEDIGYAATAGCLPEHGSVLVVLHNRVPEYILGMASPLVNAVTSAGSD